MEFLEKLVTVLQILTAVAVIFMVLLQEGKEDGSIVTGE